ncbi:MAG: helix-turn-helix transcriptional regulator [Clostridia bacterium]|nr:helix-turn-helix transcriptional regulator [Clostridia bacterium]
MNRIKKLRKELGWKQDELGKLLNVKRAAISKYETERVPLTDETISLLCDIFNVSADYLIGRSDTKIPFDKKTTPKNIWTILETCSDLNEEELKKVKEYIDFLKTTRK